MTDRITANLPSRDFGVTETFYARLGFERAYRDDGWMILTRGAMQVEFFAHPSLDPAASWFSACLRVDDMPGLHAAWLALGLEQDAPALPRIGAKIADFGGHVPRMFFLHDPDGSLWRVIQNPQP